MISLSGGFYVTVTFQSAISQIITRVQPPAPIVGIILILIPARGLGRLIPIRKPLLFQFSSSLQGSGQGDLVGVFQVTPHG
jgi:hypothetical protein